MSWYNLTHTHLTCAEKGHVPQNLAVVICILTGLTTTVLRSWT